MTEANFKYFCDRIAIIILTKIVLYEKQDPSLTSIIHECIL